jgi:predicted porin
MNKKLVALAVSAIAAGAASAQTANVTLYGVVDTYLANIRANNGGKSLNVLDAGGLSGSRWGLRGAEDLGGGLKAVFTIESGFDSSTGSLGQGGRLFGRQAYVGLNGGFGSLTVGRQYAPIFYVGCSADLDCYSNPSVVTNQFLLIDSTTTLRIDNSVIYKSPNMGGFTVQGMYAFGEVAGTSSGGRTLGLNAEYSNGPIYAGIGWGDRKNAAGVGIARNVLAGASYNFGVASLSATYFQFNNPATSAPKLKAFHVGGMVPLGAFSVIAQIGQLKQGSAKQSDFMIGGDYTLSKRTNLYARYLNANNNASSAFDIPGMGGAVGSGAGGALVAGQDKSALAIGVRHRF